MSESYDLMVIGAGMAGVAAATKCAATGWRVGIVDSLPYGGTCALRGCDPKKILRRGAEIIDGARLMSGKGIDEAGLRISWGELMAHKHGFTDPVPQSMEDNLTSHGVDTLHGRARFTGPTRLEVDGTGYAAERVLIATGARPRPLDFPGDEHLIDSTAFLDLDALPPRILFVGGGFVSFELAHIAARVGAATVIVDRGHRPLGSFDPDLVELLVTRGRQVGVELRRSTTITTPSSGATSATGSPWSATGSPRPSRPTSSSTARAGSPTSPSWALTLPASTTASTACTSTPTCRAPPTPPSGPPATPPTPPGCP